MAYPVIASTSKGSTAVNATSTTITPPAGTADGDLLILLFTKDGTAAPVSNSGGFTQLAGSADSNGSYLSIMYKKLTAEQTSFAVVTASEMTSWIMLRIPGGDIDMLFSTVATGSSTLPNPGSLASTWATGTEILWLAVAGWDYNRSCTAYPTTFTDSRDNSVSTNTGGTGTAVAALSTTTTPQDPGTFTISATDTWIAYTLAIKMAVVDSTIIDGIIPPITGRAPLTTVTETFEYTGTVSWSPNDATFVESTVYTATITLTPKAGYTLTGVAANQFTVAGTSSDTNSANSGVITAVFPAATAIASPTIITTTTGIQIAANDVTNTIVVPAGTQSGDLMILLFSKDGINTPNTPTDWTLLGATATTTSNYSIFYRQLTGALSDFTVTHADYEKTSWILLQIPDGDIPQISTAASGTDAAPNSLSLTHTFASGTEVLWVSTWGSDYNRYIWPVDSWPTDLPLNRTQNRPLDTSAATSCMAAALNTSASFDPSGWTISGADEWVAYTLAIALIAETAPTIEISTITRTKISDETGLTTSDVTFQCSLAATQWEARASIDSQTPGPGVGLLVGSGGAISANTDVNFDVIYTELTSGDRIYRIDVYCYVGGAWY